MPRRGSSVLRDDPEVFRARSSVLRRHPSPLRRAPSVVRRRPSLLRDAPSTSRDEPSIVRNDGEALRNGDSSRPPRPCVSMAAQQERDYKEVVDMVNRVRLDDYVVLYLVGRAAQLQWAVFLKLFDN